MPQTFTSISQLKQAFKGSGPLMIASPDPFERRWIVENLGITGRWITAPAPVATELETPSLFGDEPWILYDECENAKGKLAELSRFSHLVLLGTKVIKGNFLTLDLTREKPWEKKDRLRDIALFEAARRGKKMGSDAAMLLVELTEGSLSAILQEIEKLALYAGAEEVLSLDMVRTLVAGEVAASQWAMAETLIFDKTCPNALPFTDASGFFQLLGALRYHLQAGLDLARGLSVPGLRPNKLSKFTPLAKRHGEEYFANGLDALYTIELKAKTTSLDPKLLYTHFVATLYDALSPA